MHNPGSAIKAAIVGGCKQRIVHGDLFAACYWLIRHNWHTQGFEPSPILEATIRPARVISIPQWMIGSGAECEARNDCDAAIFKGGRKAFLPRHNRQSRSLRRVHPINDFT